MSYSHYQHASPAWGTTQYQFGPPPTPTFQSQPSWDGIDYYRAHASTQDPALFDHAWGRVRDHTGLGTAPLTPGVGIDEARLYHKRAYSLGELNRMLPADIGHAAAYEAYRSWSQHSSMRSHLDGDVHRQREGLIGLAVGEAVRLLPYAGRPMDDYARTTASETAAATASILFYEGREERGGYRRSRSRTRFGHVGSSYEDRYPYDDEIPASYENYRHHHRSHSRPRSRSRSRSHSRPPTLQLRSGYPEIGYAPSMPVPTVPGIATSYQDQSPTYGSYPGNSMQINMPSHGAPYPHTAVPLGSAGSYPGQSYQSQPLQPYQSSHGYGQPYQSQPIPMQVAPSHRGRSTSIGYSQQQQQQPQVIIIKSSGKHHDKHRSSRHHRHHSSTKHSRSISPYRDHYPDNYRR